ncbi:AAA family ATPase [Moraxella osloensis]|uniref:Recombination factor protein RarA n=1 Tax=Faucicola osloensis TaxID=34062 RepID=A0A378Q7N6_FAUOS|nr:AAA family ATPase [Moraxella osloensis]AME01204.1 AAA family ATPase [Moraxella osloensis]OBX56208.1 AAA family ATPase [Moraxella osloensis]QPT43062.1 AAA family ATPase [Moraxella osloensis]STY96682.1 recombination factor protein RarA [Moraxella osloensis]
MVMGNLDNQPLQQRLQAMLVSINDIVLDKPAVVKLAVACLLANGHLLLQDLPGMGKTTLAHAIANHLGLSFNRVQFTSDMLPADILGISLYKTDTGTFEFKTGPIFCQLLLADEINRSSPKTQSALLEAMEERQVSQDGVTRKLPEPFFVIATQNPTQQSGVFILPESQLDRFLMCLSLGYPSVNAERELLLGKDRRQMLSQITPMLDTQSLQQAQAQAKEVYIADVVIDYLQRLVAKTRESRDYHGLSTRGVLALKQAAQAFAYLGGYNEVTPEDIQAVFAAVVDHRLGQAFIPFNHLGGEPPQSIATQLLRQVPVLV